MPQFFIRQERPKALPDWELNLGHAGKSTQSLLLDHQGDNEQEAPALLAITWPDTDMAERKRYGF